MKNFKSEVEVPAQFIELIEEYLPDDVNLIIGLDGTVIQTKYGDRTLADLRSSGAFDPQTNTIYINCNEVMREMRWTRRGIRLSASIWLTLIESFFHELTHAEQLRREPHLKNYDVLPIEYEQEATDVAILAMSEWLADNPIPKIADMGWFGKQLVSSLQYIISSNDPNIIAAVKHELELDGTELAVELETLAQLTNEIEENELERLRSHIDEGLIGGKINEKYYLTVYEAIDCK